METTTAAGKAFFTRPIPVEHAAVVGVAGEVAVLLMDDPAREAWEVLEYLDLEPVSDTDREAIGAVTEPLDGERCLSLLRDLWPDVQREAAELVALAEELEG